MEQYLQPPAWLGVIGWIALAAAFISSLTILYDLYGNGFRQKMKIMHAVYPLTALYFCPFALWFYYHYGRKKSPMWPTKSSPSPKEWQQVSEAATHCGAGCTLGDIIAEWLVFSLGITIAGKALFADYIFDFIFAWLLGIIFQYLTIAPMRGLKFWKGIKQAIKADTFSIITFQIGLFAGMYVYQEVLFSLPLPKTSSSYWFLMQLAMILGFLVSYFPNRWLLKAGIKERM